MIKYYNVAMKNIQTTRNFRFLMPAEPIPLEEIAIDPSELEGGQNLLRKGGEGSGTWSVDLRKRQPTTDLEEEEDPDTP